MMWTEAWPGSGRRGSSTFGHTIPAAVGVALIMGLIFALLIAYPWIEKK